MPNYLIIPSSTSPAISSSIGGQGTGVITSGLLQEIGGYNFFALESGSGVILLEM